MTRFTMLALVCALTASAVSVPANAQVDLRSPVRSDPNTINPAPIIGHGAAVGAPAIGTPLYHGQAVQGTTQYGVSGEVIHVPGAGNVRIQSGAGAAGGSGVTTIDAGQKDNRVPASQYQAPAPQASSSSTQSRTANGQVKTSDYVDNRSATYDREKRVLNPVVVMQSGIDGKGVSIARSRDRDYDDDDDDYGVRRNRRGRGRAASYRSSRNSNYYDDDEDDFDNGYVDSNRHGDYSARENRRGLRDIVDAEDDLIYHREQLIPYKYKKHDGIGLYRPWMYNVKWNYWYGCNFRPYVPGVPDRYSPIMTEYGLYPRGNLPQGGMPMASAGMNVMPVGNAMPMNATYGNAVVDGSMLSSSAPMTMQAAPGYSMGYSAQPLAQPWNYQTQAYGHGIHPGFDDVSYRPRHAGSYSPYVGPYGFGGRFNYGYGPYNYQWSGGYSGFSRTGNFNYWLPQSGLQY